MKLSARIPMAATLLFVLGGTLGCKMLRARDQLVKGVQEFKAGHYEAATNHFQQSIDLDPSYDTARLYLATAYSYQVVANDDTPGNVKLANKAMDGFNQVLAKDPKDLTALRQIASLHREIKMWDTAKADEMKILAVNPNDAEADYTIGNIDWNLAYKNATQILNAAGITDKGDGNPGKSKDTCAKLVAANTDLVNESIKYLSAAIANKANYDDAMSMINLAYRRKADLECGNDAARKADIATADDWLQKAMGARKANEIEKEKKLSGGIDLTK